MSKMGERERGERERERERERENLHNPRRARARLPEAYQFRELISSISPAAS